MMVLMIMNVVLFCINAYDDKYDDETETDGLI
jgi:hypothetical protein